MLYMEHWRVCPPECYCLGFEGDHLAASFQLTAPLPEGWDLKVDVEKDGQKNTIQLQREGEVFSAELTASMLAVDGYYFMQIRGTCGDVVRHSNVFLAQVFHSINAQKAFPDPLPSEFEQMERRLSDLNRHPPKPGAGVWLVWNVEQGAYEASDIPLPGGLSSGEIKTVQVLEQWEYEALPVKDGSTLYLIRG